MFESIVPWLFGFTVLVVLLYALQQWRSARRARDKHEHSAMPPPDVVRREQESGARRS